MKKNLTLFKSFYRKHFNDKVPFSKRWHVYVSIFICFVLLVTLWLVYILNSSYIKSQITMNIKNGETIYSISERLFTNNVVKNPHLLIYTYRAMKSLNNNDLRFGEFTLDQNSSVLEVVKKITDPLMITRYSITIPEGLTLRQVKELFHDKVVVEGDFPNEIKEGYLMPNTWSYSRHDDIAKIVRRIYDAQVKFLEEAWNNRDKEIPLKTKEEALILASIVEEETGNNDNPAVLAGVFINRLKKNMKLQSDPTVAYGLGRDNGLGITLSDLQSNTLYNTYKIRGLPPTPISNPSRASILAVMNPAKHDYLYFVADGKGGHFYSSTLVEHNKNVKRWREIESKIVNTPNQ